MSKRGANLAARKRGLNHHHVGKRCVKPKTSAEGSPIPQGPQTTPSSPDPAPSPTPEPTSNTNTNPSNTNTNPSNTNTNPNNNSGNAPDADAQEWLSAHNTARANYGAAPLTWSDDLANAAQRWGSGCKFQHSGGTLGQFGENLAAQTGSMTPAQATQMWMDEAGGPVPRSKQLNSL
jgi:uncharacterized protein YkwD